jgi:hypothetical protein
MCEEQNMELPDKTFLKIVRDISFCETTKTDI